MHLELKTVSISFLKENGLEYANTAIMTSK